MTPPLGVYNFTWTSHFFSRHSNYFILFTQVVHRCWLWYIHSINDWKYTHTSNNISFLFKSKYHISRSNINLTRCTAGGANFTIKVPTFHLFPTPVYFWIPPNFREWFHYKLASAAVSDFFPYIKWRLAALILFLGSMNLILFAWYNTFK
jgi:hypothetical protein